MASAQIRGAIYKVRVIESIGAAPAKCTVEGMRKMTLALALALVVGCGPTSYSKATRSTPLGTDRWIIEVHGRKLRAGRVLKYMNLRASTLCPDGYVVEQTTSGNTVNATTGRKYAVNGRDQYAAVIRCGT